MCQKRRRGFEWTAVNQGMGRSLAWPGEEVNDLPVQAVVSLRRTHAVTVTGPGGAVPAGFDRQLGSAFLDAVVQQLGLWDLIQV
ncbi:hypothetical protein INR49_007055 [Caranx melampygus]|nr:hypothetical protein INR49_007064 [Caranx melampygus]KAG7233403.1 hypothetical protein INR49_007055 [Caranx melampygus]